jgi:16S rRNA (guanine966-N2)-methyltransferase
LVEVRVVAGTARGRRLASVPTGTRPVSDRAREGLFSSLGDAVEGAAVLDLYAGTGALAIEALSRGAASATFVDSAPGAIRTIRTNLELTGFSGRAEVRRRDVLRFLRESGDRYELVMADPPYDIPPRALNALVRALPDAVGGRGWRAVLTRPVQGYTPVIPVHWRLARGLRYGDTLVLVYEEG